MRGHRVVLGLFGLTVALAACRTPEPTPPVRIVAPEPDWLAWRCADGHAFLSQPLGIDSVTVYVAPESLAMPVAGLFGVDPDGLVAQSPILLQEEAHAMLFLGDSLVYRHCTEGAEGALRLDDRAGLRFFAAEYTPAPGLRPLRQRVDSATVWIGRELMQVSPGGVTRVTAMAEDHGANVTITLDERGRRDLAAATRARVGQPMAFVYDGFVLNTPLVQEPITGGRFSMGGLSREEALAIQALMR